MLDDAQIAQFNRDGYLVVEDVIDVHGLKLDPVSHRVTSNDEPLDMGPTEFKLLHFFMTHHLYPISFCECFYNVTAYRNTTHLFYLAARNGLTVSNQGERFQQGT